MRTLAATLGVFLLAVPSPSPAPPVGAAPAPPVGEVVEPGWREVFATEFTGSRPPRGCGPYEGPHGQVAASAYRPDEVRVSGGLLRLRLTARPYLGRAYSAGGLGCYQLAQTYGRYEFRARAPLGAGIDAYVTVWPQGPARSDALMINILPRPDGERIYLTNGYGPAETAVWIPGRFSDGFHTYRIEWAPGSLRVLVDGAVVLDDPHASSVPRWIGFAMASGDRLTGVPDEETRLPAEFQVDWLRIAAYAPSARTSAPAAPPPAEPSWLAAVPDELPPRPPPPPAAGWPLLPFALGAVAMAITAAGLALARRYVR